MWCPGSREPGWRPPRAPCVCARCARRWPAQPGWGQSHDLVLLLGAWPLCETDMGSSPGGVGPPSPSCLSHSRGGNENSHLLAVRRETILFCASPSGLVTGYPPSPSKRKTHGPPAPRGLTPPADRHGLHPAPVCPTPEKGFQGSRDRPGSSQRVLNPNEK